jgi:hypothetical protein
VSGNPLGYLFLNHDVMPQSAATAPKASSKPGCDIIGHICTPRRVRRENAPPKPVNLYHDVRSSCVTLSCPSSTRAVSAAVADISGYTFLQFSAKALSAAAPAPISSSRLPGQRAL